MNKYHNSDHQNSLNGPPKKPGLVFREQQVAAAQQEATSYRAEDTGPGVTGNVALKQQLATKKRALKRQQQLAAGQYPSGR